MSHFTHSNPTKGADDGLLARMDGLLARNIPQFHSVNQLPIKLDPARLDDGSGIQETLKTNHAQYRASCRILLNNTKLQRTQKGKGLQVMEMRAIAAAIQSTTQRPNLSKGRMLSVQGGRG